MNGSNTCARNADGKVNEYTFLAPTSTAFIRAIPQDIANPFSYDKQLRHNVLLRHFVRRSLTKEDLEAATLTELTMADNTLFKMKHNGGGDTSLIFNFYV